MRTTAAASLLLAGGALLPGADAQRPMEKLGRGVVAVRTNDTDVFVSWRLLGLDPDDLAFNIYRASGDDDPVQLNGDPLTSATNYADHDADLSQDNTYFIHPVVDGEEQEAGGTFTLPADNPAEPVVRIPIQSGGSIKFVWVGDLDGDGEYDFVLDRQTAPQKLEAYRSDGTLLWEVDMGPNSEEQNNISPGPATLNVGHWDGVTVYDFDSDGYAEVAVRIANGVTFGDGETFNEGANDTEQFIAILDGRTGALRASAQVPTDYISDGPMGARFGVGYLDGETPHLVTYMKNRQESGDFNLMMAAWTFDGSDVSNKWVWLRGDQDAPDGHNSRSIDADGDGRDEVHEIGFVLNGEGELHYSLGPDVVHGDRFHIAKMDPGREGLQGYGVQQRNPSGLLEYYYDATDGTMLWEHSGDPEEEIDVGRGMVGDIDPTHEGMEVWSFSGVYNAPSNELTTDDPELAPWPHLGLFWDGDILMELYNDGKIEKWDWTSPSDSRGLPRLLTVGHFGAVNTHGPNPGFHGDILGDWREEVILVNEDNDELIIFTTDQPTDVRLYTLAHNPAYRNSMTFKGYVQSHHVDYFIGQDMEMPPKPNIRYVGE
ncbi:hypothetical protein VUR80DRAFT_5576 [Thermomyces stellatus]